ncbi:MAG: cysteine desulfurase family protein [Planctomycetota bacterium]|nr:cysteine desulfurase family protein [Planctomycetota bacterium]
MRVHLDHNATTPIRPEALEVLCELSRRLAGNPSSVHAAGREARGWLDEARERTAAALGCHEDEVVFTSGGTESIQLALAGAVRAGGPGRGLVTCAVEHSAVLAAADRLEREGRPVVRLPVDGTGRVSVDALEAALTPATALVSIQTANNELGTLQPVVEIGELLARRGRGRPAFHTDAVQALGRIPLRAIRERADLLSFSAHKVGGPTGVGVLVRRTGLTLEPLLGTGSQEGGLRPGTESVAAIAAAAVAIELAVREQGDYAARSARLCRSLWEQLTACIPGVLLNGPDLDAPRLPNTLNVSLPGVEGRTLVARLDLEGLEASAGSACASGSLEPSHVLLALGHASERARAALRLSFGRMGGEEDVHNTVEILRRTISAPR